MCSFLVTPLRQGRPPGPLADRRTGASLRMTQPVESSSVRSEEPLEIVNAPVGWMRARNARNRRGSRRAGVPVPTRRARSGRMSLRARGDHSPGLAITHRIDDPSAGTSAGSPCCGTARLASAPRRGIQDQGLAGRARSDDPVHVARPRIRVGLSQVSPDDAPSLVANELLQGVER